MAAQTKRPLKSLMKSPQLSRWRGMVKVYREYGLAAPGARAGSPKVVS